MRGRREKVSDAIGKVVDLLEREELAPVALAVFRTKGERPSDRWSCFNRMLMFTHGTEDARGFRQWQQVGRRVKKGAKAFYILVPIRKEVPVKNGEVVEKIEELRREHCESCGERGGGEGRCEECWVSDEILSLKQREVFYVEKLVGFKPVPVFRKEDTEGAPLPEDELQRELKIPCEFESLVEELGITVKAKPFDGRFYGCYTPHRREITLASPETLVFLHEISHAVDDKLSGLEGSKDIKECVAELSAAVIAYLLGYKVELKHVKRYLHSHGFSGKTLYRIFQRVERIVNFVVERTGREAGKNAPPGIETLDGGRYERVD